MAESERSELEEKFVHLQVKAPAAESSVFESVPAESSAHDGANRKPEDTGAEISRSASVKGFAQSSRGSFTEAMEQRKSVTDAESDCWEKAPGDQEWVHSAPEPKEFFIGEESTAALPSESSGGGFSPAACSESGSGEDSPKKLAAALSILGGKLAAAASVTVDFVAGDSPAAEPIHPAATREEHDPFEEFDRTRAAPDASARAEERLAKIEQSFFSWTAKAAIAKDRFLGKLDGAPEKIQDWKQRTTASLDKAGEKLDDFRTRVDSKLDSHAQDWTEKHIPRLLETTERVSKQVSQAFEDTSKDVRQALETTGLPGGECQATMSLVDLEGGRTGDEMTDAYLSQVR